MNPGTHTPLTEDHRLSGGDKAPSQTGLMLRTWKETQFALPAPSPLLRDVSPESPFILSFCIISVSSYGVIPIVE